MYSSIQPAAEIKAPRPTTKRPPMDELYELADDGYGIATDGCEDIEPDGTCEHGHESWLRYLGYI